MGGLKKRAADHVLDVPHRHARDRRRAAARRVLLEGRDSLEDVLERPHRAVGARGRHGVPDGDLHVPAAVPGVLRRAAHARPTAAATTAHGAHGTRTRHGARGHGARRHGICTTRRRRWRSRSSCSRSDRSLAGYVGMPHALGTAATGSRRSSSRASRRLATPRRPRPPAAAAEARRTSAGTELGADGALDARRARRHRRRDDVLPAAARARRRAGGAVQRPAPAAAEQVLRGRDLRRRRSCSRSSDCRRACCGAASMPA